MPIKYHPKRRAILALALFRRTALKTGGIVDTARALVSCYLRIRTQWTRAVHLAVRHVRRDHGAGRFPLLHPTIERSDLVERIGPLASTAVRHSGSHEQANISVRLISASQRILDALEVSDC